MATTRGGKREGAGRNPGPFAPYRQRNVNLSDEAWRFVAQYQERVSAKSINLALEEIIRTHPQFRPDDEDYNVESTNYTKRISGSCR